MVTGIGRKSKMNNTGDQIHDLHKGFGKVPKYLQKFKQNREEEMKQKEIEKELAKIPVGCRKLDEEERVKMLDELQTTQKELQMQLHKMPLSMRTIAIQKRKSEMEQQLDRVENNIKLFSKQVVYISH